MTKAKSRSGRKKQTAAPGAPISVRTFVTIAVSFLLTSCVASVGYGFVTAPGDKPAPSSRLRAKGAREGVRQTTVTSDALAIVTAISAVGATLGTQPAISVVAAAAEATAAATAAGPAAATAATDGSKGVAVATVATGAAKAATQVKTPAVVSPASGVVIQSLVNQQAVTPTKLDERCFKSAVVFDKEFNSKVDLGTGTIPTWQERRVHYCSTRTARKPE